MEIHYLIILEDGIVDADEDKKWIKMVLYKVSFLYILWDKNNNITVILQIY